ncbi:hypothetical protein QTJ16_006441 [Diplocarpon rosae]|uniref:Protein kinase domain-containing protein n=1 Tax=Diplocarpon rosae TaxID=946125 RepID=A0AAD9SVU2_9HELO|nr:hypothetical protein QTJ16_006441 [Diplocarpon rosae]
METALSTASFNGHSSVVGLLIDAKACVDAKDHFGWTPLLHAVHKGHLAVVSALLAAGADITVNVGTGKISVIELAILSKHREIQLLLLNSATQLFDQTKLDAFPPTILAHLEPARQSQFRDEYNTLVIHVQQFLSHVPPAENVSGHASHTLAVSDLHLSSFRTIFALGSKCGSGSWSQAISCRHRASGLRFCAKVPRKCDSKITKTIMKEFHLLRTLKHDNIIRTKGLFVTGSMVLMVTELAPYGDFHKYMAAEKRRKLSDSEVREFFVQVFGAIEYLVDPVSHKHPHTFNVC